MNKKGALALARMTFCFGRSRLAARRVRHDAKGVMTINKPVWHPVLGRASAP
jgi:hypothetical protein